MVEEMIGFFVGATIGMFLGVLATLWIDRIRRKERYIDDFSAAIFSELELLASMPDNLDQSFVERHISTIRRLSIHREYYEKVSKRKWEKIKPKWDAFTLSGDQKELSLYVSKLITREVLVTRLNQLLFQVRNT